MGSLAGPLPMALGGDATAISDYWAARLRALVYTQYAQSNWAIPLANAIGQQRGSLALLESALLLLWSIDTVVDDTQSDSPFYGVGRGVQLDRIGKLIGQPRGAASDNEYRPILRARIRANKSNGASDDVIGVFLAMFNGEGEPLLTPGWIAQYTLRLVGVIMDPLIVTAAVGLLRSATQAGTRAVLEWTVTAPASCFVWCNLPGTTLPGWGDLNNLSVGGALAGAQSI